MATKSSALQAAAAFPGVVGQHSNRRRRQNSMTSLKVFTLDRQHTNVGQADASSVIRKHTTQHHVSVVENVVYVIGVNRQRHCSARNIVIQASIKVTFTIIYDCTRCGKLNALQIVIAIL